MQQRPVLVMGICGVGKSTIAAAIAESLDGRFIEADSYHDSASVARMRAGLPLTDEMRWGWLDRLGDAVVAAQKRAVLACSALGRAHRDRLRHARVAQHHARHDEGLVGRLVGPRRRAGAGGRRRVDHFGSRGMRGATGCTAGRSVDVGPGPPSLRRGLRRRNVA